MGETIARYYREKARFFRHQDPKQVAHYLVSRGIGHAVLGKSAGLRFNFRLGVQRLQGIRGEPK